jgi:hypothetical protein
MVIMNPKIVALQALLRELAAFNEGLCLITTRLPVVDVADYEGTSGRELLATTRSLHIGDAAQAARCAISCNPNQAL